jgi:hypothetical protein
VKRALFVSAGTVAGLVASLSYSPGLLDAIGAPAAGKHGPNASGKSLKVNSAFEGGSNGGQRAHKNKSGSAVDRAGPSKSGTGKKPDPREAPRRAQTILDRLQAQGLDQNRRLSPHTPRTQNRAILQPLRRPRRTLGQSYQRPSGRCRFRSPF